MVPQPMACNGNAEGLCLFCSESFAGFCRKALVAETNTLPFVNRHSSMQLSSALLGRITIHAALSAALLQETHGLDRRSPLHGFDHVVKRQSGNGSGRQSLHLD